jgi:hypothetical protein
VPQRRPRTVDERKPGFDTPQNVESTAYSQAEVGGWKPMRTAVVRLVHAVGTTVALADGMKTGNQIIGDVLRYDGRQST